MDRMPQGQEIPEKTTESGQDKTKCPDCNIDLGIYVPLLKMSDKPDPAKLVAVLKCPECGFTQQY